MSMIGNFLLVDDATIRRLLEAPEGIHELLEQRVYEADPPTDHVDADKSWHALHFLLTGTDWGGEPPLDFIVAGGTPVGEEDVGYGPARALRAPEVVALGEALRSIEPHTLIGRFDGAKMDKLEIYPSGGWASVDARNPEELGYLTGAYEEIAALVQKGAANGMGLLIWLT